MVAKLREKMDTTEIVNNKKVGNSNTATTSFFFYATNQENLSNIPTTFSVKTSFHLRGHSDFPLFQSFQPCSSSNTHENG